MILFSILLQQLTTHTKESVRKDVEHFNAVLSDKMKSQGIKYVCATGSTQYSRNIRDENGKIRVRGSCSYSIAFIIIPVK